MLGGTDGVAGVYSVRDGNITSTMKSEGAAISNGIWAGDKIVISTTSGAVKIFEGQNEISNFQAHSGSVTALTLHPSGDIFASASDDKSYVIYDIESSKVLTQVFTDSGRSSIITLCHRTNFQQTSHVHNFILTVISWQPEVLMDSFDSLMLPLAHSLEVS